VFRYVILSGASRREESRFSREASITQIRDSSLPRYAGSLTCASRRTHLHLTQVQVSGRCAARCRQS